MGPGAPLLRSDRLEGDRQARVPRPLRHVGGRLRKAARPRPVGLAAMATPETQRRSLTSPSRRVESMPPYMFAELERRIAAKREAGIDVISLGIGDPDEPTYPHIVEA